MLHLCFRAVSERESKTVQKIGQNQKSRSSVFLSSKTKRKRLLRRLTTHGSDKSLGVYWRIFVKIFVSATDFCRRNKSHKFRLISPSFAEASLCCRGGGGSLSGSLWRGERSDLIICDMLLSQNSVGQTKILWGGTREATSSFH